MNDISTVNKVSEKVSDFIVENFLFGNKDAMTAPEDSFMENGIIDSLGILELIEFCEENFSISIEDDELIPENLDSLNNITDFIKRKN